MQRTYSDEEEKAGKKIKQHMLGFHIRKKFSIPRLKRSELESYKTFVVGSDPVMPKALADFHEPEEKIAFIGTSGMRSVSLACKLGNKKNIPKIILVDNSYQVHLFWETMISLTEASQRPETFFMNLHKFLHGFKELYRDMDPDEFASYAKVEHIKDAKYLNQDTINFFTALFSKHGYDYVRAVIKHTLLIRQDWANPEIFVKINNITRHLGIKKTIVYPSNIVGCLHDRDLELAVLKNIASLKPTLAIHANVSEHHIPTKIFLLTNQEPEQALCAIELGDKNRHIRSSHSHGMSSIEGSFLNFLFDNLSTMSVTEVSLFGCSAREKREAHCTVSLTSDETTVAITHPPVPLALLTNIAQAAAKLTTEIEGLDKFLMRSFFSTSLAIKKQKRAILNQLCAPGLRLHQAQEIAKAALLIPDIITGEDSRTKNLLLEVLDFSPLVAHNLSL